MHKVNPSFRDLLFYNSFFIVVGNAAFHSRELYPVLQSCLRSLVTTLSDGDEKTRANAAGAIGNLVRNSGELSETIASLGIISVMMKMVVQDPDITTQVRRIMSLKKNRVYLLLLLDRELHYSRSERWQSTLQQERKFL